MKLYCPHCSDGPEIPPDVEWLMPDPEAFTFTCPECGTEWRVSVQMFDVNEGEAE